MYAYVITHADDDALEEPLNGRRREMLIAPYMPPIDGISIVYSYIQQSSWNMNYMMYDIYNYNYFCRSYFCNISKYRSTRLCMFLLWSYYVVGGTP
jgi:hypothetical protein